jgi:hypothetical protein
VTDGWTDDGEVIPIFRRFSVAGDKKVENTVCNNVFFKMTSQILLTLLIIIPMC